MAQRIISADSHVLEPGNLWIDRVDRKFREQAPRVLEQDGSWSLVAPGITPVPISSLSAAGKSSEELREHMGKGYEAARSSGWDPAARLKDQDVDGVEAEVLYTSLGMPLFGLEDGELQRACFAAFNDWLVEYCAYSPERLVGIGLISTEDIAGAVAELERCRKLGLRGAMICGLPPSDKQYSNRIYDPLWQAASDLEMPLSLHVVTGKRKNFLTATAREIVKAESDAPGISRMGMYMFLVTDVQQSLFTIVMGGVLHRHPRLRLISAENDSGWIPHFLYRMDHTYKKLSDSTTFKLDMPPSDYVRRQVWATFQDDPVGPATFKFFGEDNYMWASDFPHTDSTWPNSHQVIEEDFAGVPDEVTRKIVFDNARKLFRLGGN